MNKYSQCVVTMDTNIYLVAYNIEDEGIIRPIKVTLPRNIKVDSNLYFFTKSTDAMRYYNAIHAPIRLRADNDMVIVDYKREKQRKKRERLLRITQEKRQFAINNATICHHSHETHCICFDTWKESILGTKIMSLEQFRSKPRHQGELNYAAFVHQENGLIAPAVYMLTYKLTWSKINKDDTVVCMLLQEKDLENIHGII